MAEKDLTEKKLEDYGDVFADIYNTLLFHEKLIEELQAGPTESVYKSATDEWREQRRDTVKEYMDSLNLTIATLGIENQASIDKYEPIRVMGYDYGSYRQQIVDGKELHPVITIVLNFTDKKWNEKKSLVDILKMPEKFCEYVQDYKINVFDVAFLDDTTIESFTSDFKLVAKFFKNKRLGVNINTTTDTTAISHPEELMELFTVFTSDNTYAEMIPEILERKKRGEVISMCTVAQELLKKGENRRMLKDAVNSIKRYRGFGLDNEQIRNIIEEDYELDEEEIEKLLNM